MELIYLNYFQTKMPFISISFFYMNNWLSWCRNELPIDQSFVLETTEPSVELYCLWIFRSGYDNNLCSTSFHSIFSSHQLIFKLNFIGANLLIFFFLFQITGAITSYLIILIQFNVAAQRSKKMYLQNSNNTQAAIPTKNESNIN